MVRVRSAAFGLALLAGVAGASAASAADVYYVSYATTTAPSSQWQSLDIQGVMSNVAATGILLTFGGDSPTDANQTVLTLCDDIFHDIYVPVSYSPELVYTAQPLAGSTYFIDDHGGTATFTANQASLLGQLINEAQSIWSAPSAPTLFGLGDKNDEIAAIQGAIWSIEYGATVTDAGNSGINSAIGDFVTQFTPGLNAGVGLYSSSGTQNQVLGLGPSGAPEPSVWAMMLAGLAGMGALLRFGRRKAPAAA
jgi:PEP-CTERM motif